MKGWKPLRCSHKRHGTSLIGDKANGSGEYFGGGIHIPIWKRHLVPTELQLDILKAAQRQEPRGRFVIDCFAGTKSLRRSCEILGLKYVSVDIDPSVYTCTRKVNGECSRVQTDLVQDLRNIDIERLIKKACKKVGERPERLLLLWCSVPCTTYSQLQTMNRVDKRHRDWNTKRAITQQVHDDDVVTTNWATQLLQQMGEYESSESEEGSQISDETEEEEEEEEGDTVIDEFNGNVISVRQPWASRAVLGRIHTILVRQRLEVPQIVGIHASCTDCDYDLPTGCVVGYVKVISARDGMWELEGSETIDPPILAKGSINLFQLGNLPKQKQISLE